MIEDRDENNDLSSPALGGDRGPSHPGTGADSASIENLEYVSKTIKQDFSSLISFSLLLISS